ncbi:hypothetical protein [Stieleria varia]|uniref:Uncharacterized protein n=1 Tax=Stieleria varia TaxID=2528005 RepID=A0A5C6B8S0_9BACT|nr:hypothetical protein [Stieleria varia]TWU08368.1 hypothetical protein Pla52n_09500 [Stieleria varia]
MVWIALTVVWFLLAAALGYVVYSLLSAIKKLAGFLKEDDDAWSDSDDKLFRHFSSLAKLLIISTLLVWIVVGFAPFLVYRWEFFSEPMMPDKLGEFRDAFGFTNTFFSGLAFGGVIIAIVLQTIELRYQRQEIRRANKEYQEQTDTLQKTAYLNAASTLLQGYLAEVQFSQSNAAKDKHTRLMRQLEVILTMLKSDFEGLDAFDSGVEKSVAESKFTELIRRLHTAQAAFKDATEPDVAITDENKEVIVEACKTARRQLTETHELVEHAVFSNDHFADIIGKSIDDFHVGVKSLIVQLRQLVEFKFEVYRPEGKPYIHRPKDPPQKKDNYSDFRKRLQLLKKRFEEEADRWNTMLTFEGGKEDSTERGG